VDFGLIRPLSIGNFVFDDVNNDGVRQPTEAGLAGVTIQLVDGLGNPVATTVTNSAGGYLFTNLTQGSYRAQVLMSSLPSRAYISSTGANNVSSGPFEPATGTSLDSTDHGSNAGTVVQGSLIDLNYGTQPLGEAAHARRPRGQRRRCRQQPPPGFGFFRTLSLGNLVWSDANNNGKHEDTEAGRGRCRRAVARFARHGHRQHLHRRRRYVPLREPLPRQLLGRDHPAERVHQFHRQRPDPHAHSHRAVRAAPLVNPNDNEDKGTITGVEIRSNPVTLFEAPNNPQLGGLGNTTVDFGLILRKSIIDQPGERRRLRLSRYVRHGRQPRKDRP